MSMEVKEYIGEVWKDIPGYYGYYQVSNIGRVRSCDRKVFIPNYGRWCTPSYKFYRGEIKKLKYNNNGYLRVQLYKNNKEKSWLVHRLVAIAFIPNPYNLPEVNHKNEMKTDNRVENLEWTDHRTNCHYGTRIERCAEGHRKQKGGTPISTSHTDIKR